MDNQTLAYLLLAVVAVFFAFRFLRRRR